MILTIWRYSLPYDVRQSVMAFLRQSPVQLMSSMAPDQDKKAE